ncbi:MAG: MATE family efflux transporter, partial [Sulfolobales archaeon]
ALAAHNIGLSVEGIIINPVFAINIAASARVGQRVGSNNVEKLDDLTRESLKIGLSWMSIATAILLLLSLFIGRAFTEDVSIARLVGMYLVLAAISEIGFGGSLALYGVIRGMGSTWVPLAVNSFTVIFLRALLAQALQPVYGIYGVWVTQVTDMYGRFAVSYAIYRKFKSKLLVKLVA